MSELVLPNIKAQIDQLYLRKRFVSFGIPSIIVLYLIYIIITFDVINVAKSASATNARTLIGDSYSYKTHVRRDNRSSDISIKIEGEKKGAYPEGMTPQWVNFTSLGANVDLGGGHVIIFDDGFVTYDIPNYGQVWAKPSRRGVETRLPEGEFPGQINASKNRVAITTDHGRLTITRNNTEVFKYHFGWELFFFTLDSPYYGKSISQIIDAAFKGEAGEIFSDFWNNKMWRHADVAWSIVETILMAFLGSFGAAILALPLAFIAAKNFTPLSSVRFVMRRFFDFVRGVDALIWTILLARAFGPGPLTGALAILITDTGSFGKMFSEALENIDEKQVEGVKSTGASPVQRYRFGVLPQVFPVLLSQVLYYFESNTRSATIIGAITGGGIGLMLTQAMITQKDWEEVTYYIILIILMVMLMDWISGKLRSRLIKGGANNEL
jgi:phosphonate transport system permease protein